MIFVHVLFLLSLPLVLGIGWDQSAGAKGRFLCNNKPASDVLVKLYDEDDFGKDDLLAKTYSNSDGYFSLQGSTSEVTTIDPKFNVYHTCNNGLHLCKKKFTIKIPDEYVNRGKIPTEVFDAGTLQLAGKFPGESHDCIHLY